jgi:hypothetical protein
MAGRTRLISVPPARGGDDRRGYRQLSGSMGALAPDPNAPMNEGVPTERFEAAVVADDDWSRTIAMREQAEGLPRANSPTSEWTAPTAQVQSLPSRRSQQDADLTSLPDRFCLEVERKLDRWKITASGVHTGLWKSGDDLPETLTEALAALAEMVRLDGVVAKPKRRPR